MRKVNDLNKTVHKTKPVSKRRLHYLLHKAEVLSNQYKAERDTCLEDIEKLREENRNLKEIHEAQTNYNCKLLEEIDELDRKYNTLTNHIRMKAEHNPGVSRYIDLVNYVDRLERADDER